MRAHLETMTTIHRTSFEAASEVQRAFPTTIECTRGKLRFNTECDVLRLSDAQCTLKNGFFKRFARYSQGAVAFAHDWHKIPQQVVFNNDRLWSAFRALEDWVSHCYLGDPPVLLPTNGFKEFIADCTSLQILVVSRRDDRHFGHFLYGFLDWYHAVPIEHGWVYGQNRSVQSLQTLCLFTASFRGLAALERGRFPILPKDYV
jgi:hypothetical protein